VLRGNVFHRGEERYLPLYEAKLIHHYDHRRATYENGDTRDVSAEEKADPETVSLPRYWVPEPEVQARLAGRWDRPWLLGWRDITNTTNERTVIAGVLPQVGVGHTLPLMLLAASNKVVYFGILINLSTLALDYVARQNVGGTHLTFFIFKQMPLLPPDTYTQPLLWLPAATLLYFLTPRVLELTYTAHDLSPWALDLGYTGPPFVWDEERRFLIRCELDALYFHLYGINREDADYILETFPIVKRKDEQRYGDYRTKRVILEIYDAMAAASRTGQPYQTRLDPPPADPRVAHKG